MKIDKLVYIIGILMLTGCSESYKQPLKTVDETADIFPDYYGVTVAPNLAPLNFMFNDSADEYQAAIGKHGAEPDIVVRCSDGKISIPLEKWHELLESNRGDSIEIRLALLKDKEWTGYRPMTVYVSADSIDGWLAYRMLYPGYELWNEMGVYQRNLSNFEQLAIVENKDIDKMCLNCHSFPGGDPNTMMLHVRGPKGGTLIHADGKTRKVNPSAEGMPNGATYPSWNPKGRYIAFSCNEVQQFFHRTGTKTTEVADMSADLMVYDVQENKTMTDSAICGDKYIETFPTWSPDGKTIYFCRADSAQGRALNQIRYDLCKVDFDAATGRFGEVEKIYNASDEGKSVSFPRVSPDGRWLMITRSDYGNFSIWHPESSLCLIDLTDNSLREMDEVNAPDAVDSYHAWSSNSKWFVFSSKRIDGLWARPFIASFDPSTGRAEKPALLPQEDPEYYGECMMTFNVPELVKGPVEYTPDLLKAIETEQVRATMK